MRAHFQTRVSHERILMELAEVNALLVLLVRLLLGDNASPLLAHIAKVNKNRYSSHPPPSVTGVAEPPAAPPASPEVDPVEVPTKEDSRIVPSPFLWLMPPGSPDLLPVDVDERN